MIKKFKPSLVALGLSAALAGGSATASIVWDTSGGTTLFEDDDIDFIYTVDDQGNLVPNTDGIIDVGDVLVSVLEFNDAGGGEILPQELSGVAAGQVSSIIPLGGGLATFSFDPYVGGLNAVLALGTDDLMVPEGGAGEGALIAIWLSNDPNLDIAADDITGGSVSCTSLSQCIDQSVDGALWEVDGFTGGYVDGEDGSEWVHLDGDEFWEAPAGQVFTDIVLETQPSIELSSFNAGASILFNGTGQELEFNSISCFPFCGTGPNADGLTDIIVGGSVKGGAGLTDSLIADGAFASSDFDMQKRAAVPEPSILALLAAGFLGIGAANRRRRKA